MTIDLDDLQRQKTIGMSIALGVPTGDTVETAQQKTGEFIHRPCPLSSQQ
ncbi:hypothetical protein [Rhizobium sp. SSA_523]|nr:hypothetical protein [Rhizobium sp. SSA_523]MCO5734446.1 hypothetical protein [Rhizobium sp. SSA_523]WKC23303.1 hypothetical protein QTJ18_21170 [Rhizobium sp. SSA_523]